MTDPQSFGHVALILGGTSAERAVSLDGGAQVAASLRRSGVEVTTCDGIDELLRLAQSTPIDRVFNLLHGRGGEDGVLQGLLCALGIPVTGTGLAGSAISMDKVVSKQLWRQAGLPTADFVEFGPHDTVDRILAELTFPLVIKPISEGSSVGVSIVTGPDGLASAIELAREQENRIMAEQFISGGEYTVAVLNGEPLPSVRIVPDGDFYDYHAKYESDNTGYFCPSGLTDDGERELASLALAAYRALHLSGWGRIDFIVDSGNKPWLLEANTTPGMTSHSLVPKAAQQAGIDFDQLCLAILETSREIRS